MAKKSEEKAQWIMKGLFKGADAQKCYEEMGNKGITPKELVEIARNPNSELHKCFEWDDSIAAEKYREEQAKLVLRQLVVVREEAERPTRVFQISTEKNVYQPTTYFMKHEDEYQALLKRVIGELKGIRNRYETIVELKGVFDEIDKL